MDSKASSRDLTPPAQHPQGLWRTSEKATLLLLLHQPFKGPNKERHLAFHVSDRWVGGVVLGMSNSVNEAFGDGFKSLWSEHSALTKSSELGNLVTH